MTITLTYNNLKTSIASWTNRNTVSDTAFAEQIPFFISLAEQAIFKDLSTLGNEKYVKGNFNVNNGIVTRPALWGKTLTFSYLDSDGFIHILERVPYEYCRSFMDEPANQPTTVIPKYYTDYGFSYILVVPSPRVSFSYEFVYLEKIQPLSDNNQTNWNTQNAYDLLFYKSMEKANDWLLNNEQSQKFASLYENRIQAYTMYDKDRKTDRFSDIMKG